MILHGMVGRIRMNAPESGRPAVEMEYVAVQAQGTLQLSADPEIEWTTRRDEAQVMGWEVAERIAAEIGNHAHAMTVSTEPETQAEMSARDMQPEPPAVRTAIPGRSLPKQQDVPGKARFARGGSRTRWRRTYVPPEKAFEINEREHLA